MKLRSTEIRKKVKHYNIPNHAHELTFSCYRHRDYLFDPKACEIFLEELKEAGKLYQFRLWAYVLMPDHVHLMIYPLQSKYSVSDILQQVKGKASARYRNYLKETNVLKFKTHLVQTKRGPTFRLWQPGCGYDRNMWSSDIIHHAIEYIEANPIRANLAEYAWEWVWSSAYSRETGNGIVPDDSDIPMDFK